MKTPKRAVVSKKVSDDEKLNSLRWTSFIQASGLPFEELSESWLNFFDQQSKPESASVELIRLVDVAILADITKENK